MTKFTTFNFTEQEFKCPCCGAVSMESSFIERLQAARTIADTPFNITSGYRCKNHNSALPNSSLSSSHLTGNAADLSCIDMRIRLKIVDSLLRAGFVRIEIAERHIHADNDFNKPAGLFLG